MNHLSQPLRSVKTSEWFPVKVGLRQGCVISSWLFNLYMDRVVREVNASVMGRGLELLGADELSCQLSQLLYMNDTAPEADSEEKLCRLVSEFGRVCERGILRVSAGMYKEMKCSKNDDANIISLLLTGEVCDEVQCLLCLRSHVH